MSRAWPWLLLALGACTYDSGADDDSADMVEVAIVATAQIPSSGACVHVVATRLSDFQVSEHVGPLASATFKVLTGETRVTATAFPSPCSQEPSTPPWIADAQIVTFDVGSNTLKLTFRPNTQITIDPEFIDGQPGALTVRPGSRVRTSRNGEDASGPHFSLDGWEVKVVSVPPVGGGGAPFESVLFSVEGKGDLPYSPRGLATPPDGTFVLQLAEIDEPLRVFDSTGAFIDSWPVVYPAGTVEWSNTDGIDAIDFTRFVRTGFLNQPIQCPPAGAACIRAGIEILEKKVASDGSTFVEVVQQIFLRDVAGTELSSDYPVGVVHVAGTYVVATIPEPGVSRLVRLNPDGTLAAGPTPIAGDAEGLFVDSSGRLVSLDYAGHLATYDASSLTPRAGEELQFPNAAGLPFPTSIAWNAAAGGFVVLADTRIVAASPGFDTVTTLPIDFTNLSSPVSIDVRPETGELAIMERTDPSGFSNPVVRFFGLASGAEGTPVTLQGISLPALPRTIAYIPARQQIVSHYRGRTTRAPIESVVFIHNLDGTLASSFDLAPAGFRVFGANYLPATDQLLLHVRDTRGIDRLLVTDMSGKPSRSYRVDAIEGFFDLAPITSGPLAGDVGVTFVQPSELARIFLP